MTQGPQNKSRFVGKLMQAWFRTATNLEELMPHALEIVGDPHRAFVKAYDLKTRRVGAPIARPGHSQYKQVCVTVLARPKGTNMEPRHHNLIMWEARGWAMGTGGLAWPKKHAQIEMTRIYPIEDRYPDLLPLDFRVDVRDFDAALMTFDGVIDGVERITPPPLNGFYIPDNSTDAFVWYLPFEDSYLGEPLHGSATLSFGYGPNEINSVPVLRDSKGRAIGRFTVGMLGEAEVEGFVVQDVMFLREYGEPIKVEL